MLRLSGAPGLVFEGLAAPRLPDKVYCLLVLLILKFRGLADRSVLAALLWEENDVGAGRVNLRNVLSQLKAWQERNGFVIVHWDTSRIWRSPDCVPSDLDALLASQAASNDTEISRIAQLYGGDLLEGRANDFASDLSAWLAQQSDAIREHVLSLTMAGCGAGAELAEQFLRRMIIEAPLDERLLRALLINLSQRARSTAAMEEYSGFARRLNEEAGAVPELETRLLAQSLGATFAIPETPLPSPSTKRTRTGLPRIVILPPADVLIDRPSANRLAASLVDDVTFGLCRKRTFAVIAPHTARAIGQGRAPSNTQLDVDYALFTRLLPGSSAHDYRFCFTLTRADTHEILLGDQLRFSLADLPSRYADLTRLVVSLVAGEIERKEQTTYRMTRSPTAYVYYLMGQERLRSVDLPDLRAARRAFRHALDLEPGFAPAMSMISRTLSLEWFVLNHGDDELLAESRRMASMAVERDPLDPAGYRELGNAALYSHDLDASLFYLEDARARAPHHADVLLDNADALVHNSRYQEARILMDEALSLNPIAPDEYKWVSATVQFFLHDFKGALRFGLSMVNPEPIGRLIAMSAHLAGEKDVARYWRDRMLERHPDFRVEQWSKIVPIRSHTDRKFVEDAMRGAGFS